VNRWLREISTLDPERDAQRIVFLDASLEFPWDTQRSLELAFYRTYAVPSIATLLDSTGEFTERAQKRKRFEIDAGKTNACLLAGEEVLVDELAVQLVDAWIYH